MKAASPHGIAQGALEDVQVLVHGKYFVSALFLQVVSLQMSVDLSLWLDEERAYTARRMCGEPFWSLLTRGEQRLAGSCISHLVNQGDLPLLRISRAKVYPIRYRLKVSA